MDINSSFNSSWPTFQAAGEALRRHGERVARAPEQAKGHEELDTATVQTRTEPEQKQAGPAVVRAADETLGRLVDTTA